MTSVVEKMENMNKKTKLILTIVGVAAVIVPAILLYVFSGRPAKEPNVSTGTRQIDTDAVEKSAKELPDSKQPISLPNPGSSSAVPN